MVPSHAIFVSQRRYNCEKLRNLKREPITEFARSELYQLAALLLGFE